MTHRILNTGVHAKFGRGYVWSEVGAVVSPYDTVEWEWNIATSGSSPGINIFEVDTPTGYDYNGHGFESGEQVWSISQLLFITSWQGNQEVTSDLKLFFL